MDRTLAIIPARSGSKGLAGKNIIEIAGEPLISWTIKAAGRSHLITKCVVSTNDLKIKRIAEDVGAQVPFLRPDELAADNTTSSDVALHCIDFFERQEEYFDNVILLEPTSPLRKHDDIDNALKLFFGNYENADGIVSVGEIHLENPAAVKEIRDNMLFPISLEGMGGRVTRRQDYPRLYFPYGVLYVIKTEVLKREKSFYTNRIMPYYIERWQNYELDDIYDFYAIESIMKNKIKEGIL